MARHEVVWSSRARLELYEVLDFYIERNGTSEYSQKLFERIKASAELLGRHPNLGRKTDMENVRALVTEDYEIIYEVLDTNVLIVLIWDCRRNPDDKRFEIKAVHTASRSGFILCFHKPRLRPALYTSLKIGG
jgi:toxin YoeB